MWLILLPMLALVAVVVLLLAVRLLLGFLVFVTALTEKRRVSYLAPADPDDPEHARVAPAGAVVSSAGDLNPYSGPAVADPATEHNRAAASLGFLFNGLYRHVAGGRYRRIRVAVWTSPDRRTLAVVVWGRLLAFNVGRTVLHSRSLDGRFLVTANRPTGLERTGMYEMLVLLAAPFEPLLRRHEQRLADGGIVARLYDPAGAAGELAATVAERYAALVERGELTYTDASQTAVRSTLTGALKAVARSFRLPPHVERFASGSARPLRPRYPAPIVWADRVVVALWLLGIVLVLAVPVQTPAQAVVRFGLFALAAALGVLVGVLKLVHRRRHA